MFFPALRHLGQVLLHEILDQGRQEVALDGGDAARRLCGDQVYSNNDAARFRALYGDLGGRGSACDNRKGKAEKGYKRVLAYSESPFLTGDHVYSPVTSYLGHNPTSRRQISDASIDVGSLCSLTVNVTTATTYEVHNCLPPLEQPVL